jgi:hypothetical protein
MSGLQLDLLAAETRAGGQDRKLTERAGELLNGLDQRRAL